MAISVVQRATGKNNDATLNNASVAFGSNNTAGNAIIVVCCGGDTTDSLMHTDFQLPTDTNSNTYEEVFWEFNTQWGMGIKAWIAYGIAAGANTINVIDNNDQDALFIYEVSGLASSNAFDVAAYAWNSTSASSYNSGSITPNNANSLLLGVFSFSQNTPATWTAGTGYSNLQSQNTSVVVSAACEEQIVSSAASYSATATSNTLMGGISAILVFSDTANTRAQVRDLGSTFTTASGSKTINAAVKGGDTAILVTYATGNTVTTTPPTDNGGSGTYTLIASALKASSADVMCVWARNANFPSTQQGVTFTYNPGTTTGGGLQLFTVRNSPLTGTAIVNQSATQANQAAGTPAPALGSVPAKTNPVITAAFWATNSANNITGRSGYQITNSMHYGTPAAAQASQYVQQGETGSTITWGGALASAFASMAVEINGSLLSQLADNFDDNSTDTTIWTSFQNTGTTVAETGGQLSITLANGQATAAYGGYDGKGSVGKYALTGSSAYVKVSAVGSVSTHAQTYMKLAKDGSNALQFIQENGTLYAQKIVSGATTTVSSATYSATNHLWWRIREASGTTYWDTSTDGSAWTNFTSTANPFTYTTFYVELAAGTYQSETSPGTATFDNFNVPISPTATNLTTAGNSTDATSYTTASVTFPARQLALAWIYSIAATTPNTPTATTTGLTWTQVNSVLDSDGVRRLTLFRAMPTSDVTGTVGFDFGGQTQTGGTWSIANYGNVDTRGDSYAVVQNATAASSGAVSSQTVTLGSALQTSTNMITAGFGIPLNTASIPTPTTGTQIGQTNQGSPNQAIESTFRIGSTSLQSNAGAASIPWTAIAVEVTTTAASGTNYTQSLTASMTPSGAFTKQARKPLTGSLPLSGVLAKRTARAFTASMTSVGVLAKKTIRALSGSLGLSGVLTASHVVIKSLTASMTPTGTLTKRAGKALSGSLPLSGVISRRIARGLTGSLPLSGVLAKKMLRSLTASMTPSGVITGFAHRFTKALTGAMTPVGVLTRKINKPLTGSLPLSGVLNKLTSKHLTGSMTPSGVLTTLKAYFRTFTASMTPTGTLTKKTIRSFTANLSFSTFFRAAVPPRFHVISRILSTFGATTIQQTTNESAELQTKNQIAELNSSGTIGTANSSSTSGTLQSKNSSGTVDTTNTNETLD